jgi:hypothetical protein
LKLISQQWMTTPYKTLLKVLQTNPKSKSHRPQENTDLPELPGPSSLLRRLRQLQLNNLQKNIDDSYDAFDPILTMFLRLAAIHLPVHILKRLGNIMLPKGSCLSKK